MGLMVDTNVFIRFEKTGQSIDFSSWKGSQDVFISVVVASELLMGVHRANTEERRQRRSAFVEAVIRGVGVLDFTLSTARPCRNLCRASEERATHWRPRYDHRGHGSLP